MDSSIGTSPKSQEKQMLSSVMDLEETHSLSGLKPTTCKTFTGDKMKDPSHMVIHRLPGFNSDLSTAAASILHTIKELFVLDNSSRTSGAITTSIGLCLLVDQQYSLSVEV